MLKENEAFQLSLEVLVGCRLGKMFLVSRVPAILIYNYQVNAMFDYPPLNTNIFDCNLARKMIPQKRNMNSVKYQLSLF